MPYVVDLWSTTTQYPVLLTVNYCGLHLYALGKTVQLLCTFDYMSSLISWVDVNDMLTVNVIHKEPGGGGKKSLKLHFLTRESALIKELLTRYSKAVLKELQSLDASRQKERVVQKRMSMVAGGGAPPGGQLGADLANVLEKELEKK